MQHQPGPHPNPYAAPPGAAQQPTHAPAGAPYGAPAPPPAPNYGAPGPAPQPAPQPPGYTEMAGVLASTTPELTGYEIVENRGVCWGIVVRSMGTVRSFSAGMRSLVRTELVEMTRTVDEARHEAERRLLAAAHARGANAVVGIRFDSSPSQGFAEITAYGTAVVVRRNEPMDPTP